MTKVKTRFPQVPVEIAKRVAKAESNGHATEPPKQVKKSSKGHVVADPKEE